MIFMLLGQLFAADLAPIELEREKGTRLYTRFSSMVSSYILPAAVVAGCATVLLSQFSPFNDHSEDAPPTGWTGGGMTGVTQLACLATTTMTQALAKTTAIQWLSVLSCFAIGARAQTIAPTPDGFPTCNCTYYSWYLTQNGIASNILAGIPCPPESSVLNLGDRNMGDTGAEAIAPALQQLCPYSGGIILLNNNHIGDTGIRALSSLVTGNYYNSWFSQFSSIDLQSNNISGLGMSSLAPALLLSIPQQPLQWGEVSSLNINNNNIGSIGVMALTRTFQQVPSMSALTELSIAGNGIGDVGAEALAFALQNIYVTTLNVGANNIGVAGTQTLATTLLSNNNLLKFFIYNNNIGDVGAEALMVTFEQLENLEVVRAQYNNISANVCTSFKKALPTVYVTCDGEPSPAAPPPGRV
jgi:hypothetical protein